MPTKYVIIAEKPSQARAIGAALGMKKQESEYIILNDGGVVIPARGHLLRIDPKTYEGEWGGPWRFDNLPVAPTKWYMMPNEGVKSKLDTFKKFLADTNHVIIATDAGREGELIARELLIYFKYTGKIDRLWTSTVTKKDLQKAWANLRPGHETEPLYHSAHTRQKCDLMFGYTLSRAVTLAMAIPRKSFRCGRVKTPVTAMIVKREWDIRNFQVKTYYELEAKVRTQSGAVITMKHAPAENERIYDKAEADRRKKLAEANPIGPLEVVTTDEKTSPELPYSVESLTYDADKKLGLTAKKLLDVAQSLYDNQIISYPRSDCAYLGEALVEDIPTILNGMKALSAETAKQVDIVNKQLTIRKNVFDDKKLSDHHAIIPTGIIKPMEPLERQVYILICERFLRAISADYEFKQTRVKMNANTVEFKTTGVQPIKNGWKDVQLIKVELGAVSKPK